MSDPVFEHYTNHLAPIYSWMIGDFDAACSAADAFYEEIGLPAGNGSLAVDLGSGHGVHAIPIARRGYRVVAIDTSTHLLDELRSVADELPIRIVSADLMEFAHYLDNESASLIACMGDTITHLPSVDAVDSLIRDAVRSLNSDGLFVLSFRDYATHELTGAARFIPVRSDENRIHNCFLDYRKETVLVHDILQTRVGSTWQTSVSAYPKLRLHPERLVATAEFCGATLVHRSVDRRMLHFAFRRSQTPNTS